MLDAPDAVAEKTLEAGEMERLHAVRHSLEAIGARRDHAMPQRIVEEARSQREADLDGDPAPGYS